MMDVKVGTYICEGCDIAQSLDISKLMESVNAESKPAVCKSHPCLCDVAGRKTIQSDIDAESIDRVVVAACSPRVFAEKFKFGTVYTDRVNLREHVVWSHEPNNEDTQMLAEDYIRMGIARVSNGKYPDPLKETINKTVLVVGGGVAGMNAALMAANAGYEVQLVEKEGHLGGWVEKAKLSFPKTPPYTDLEPTGIDDLIEQVKLHPKIATTLSATVARISGQPGQFKVNLTNGNGDTEFEAGAIVQATGWRPYDANKLEHLGYSQSPDIITNVEMEEMARRGKLVRPSDGKPPKRVLFVQCAGSRDKDHLPYCSAVCCRVSLKQALYVREADPEAQCFIIYKDIRSPMQAERFYARVQEDEGIFLTKGEVTRVTPNGSSITVEAEKTLLGENLTLEVDLVVLATGMVSSTKVDVHQVSVDPQPGDEQPQEDAATTSDGKKMAAGAEVGARILNLSYRQGTDLPTLKYGFPDSHFICFPYETRRTAIYAAGTVRAPMDSTQSKDDGAGAALKAIQALEMTARGETVHPRARDLTSYDFALQRCTQCKRCTEECPFGALDEDAKGTPLLNPMRCRRCGTCLGACPVQIINFQNYGIVQTSRIIKSISMPEEDEEKPRILVFMCENDAYPALDIVGARKMKYNAMLRVIPVRCLGAVNTLWINDALASGFDGVMAVGCKHGDNYQCHFMRGSELLTTRMDNVREKLQQLMLEEERVQIHELSIDEFGKIPQLFDDFLEEIETMGPNPFKDL